MSTATAHSWVERLVEAERSNPLSDDDDPSLKFSHLEVDDTWTQEEIAAIKATDHDAWHEENEAIRLSEEAAEDAEGRAQRAKRIQRNGISPLECAAIMAEVARWKRHDNGRHCDGSDAPLVSSSAREVLFYIVRFASWATRERDTTVKALQFNTGYRHEKTIRRALRELIGLGLIEPREERSQRVRVRLPFGNPRELRALLMQAATRRCAIPKAAAAKPVASPSNAKSAPPSGPCLSTSLLLGSVPEPRALCERAGHAGQLKTSRAPTKRLADETSGAAHGGDTSTATPGTRGASPHAVPPMAARLSTAPKAPGRDESQRTRGSTTHAGARGASETPKGSVRVSPTKDTFTSRSGPGIDVLAMLEALPREIAFTPPPRDLVAASSLITNSLSARFAAQIAGSLESLPKDPRLPSIPRPNFAPPPLPPPPPKNVYDLQARRLPRKRKRPNGD